MNFNDYQDGVVMTSIYPEGYIFPLLALCEEVGEVQGKFAKSFRDGTKLDRLALKKELGDVLWNLSALCYEMGFKLDDVAQCNLDKLADRVKRGVVSGSGDDR